MRLGGDIDVSQCRTMQFSARGVANCELGFSGDVGILSVRDENTWTVEHILKGGHEDIVRCLEIDPTVSIAPSSIRIRN
jgi:hypothetical protein